MTDKFHHHRNSSCTVISRHRKGNAQCQALLCHASPGSFFFLFPALTGQSSAEVSNKLKTDETWSVVTMLTMLQSTRFAGILSISFPPSYKGTTSETMQEYARNETSRRCCPLRRILSAHALILVGFATPLLERALTYRIVGARAILLKTRAAVLPITDAFPFQSFKR